MTKKVAMAAALAMLSLALVPAASAHGAAPPLPYLTRLLSDHSDDWLGVQDGHNLIALDAYATYNETLGGDTLVLRLIISGNWAANSAKPELAEHITFKVKDKEQELAIMTEDDATFEVEMGFQAVRGPYPQLKADGTPDGDRKFVEGLITYRALGAEVGDATTDWFVTGEAGDSDGDLMPQGFVAGYEEPGCTVPQQDPVPNECIAFNIGSYTLRAPDYYAKLAAPAMADIAAGKTDATFDVTVTNNVTATAQSFTLSATPPNGVTVLFQPDGATEGKASAAIDLPADGSAKVKAAVHVTGLSAGTYDVPVWVTSNLGGRTVATIQVMVPAPVTNGNSTAPGGTSHPPAVTTPPAPTSSTTEAKKSPGVPTIAVLSALAACIALARRRLA